MLKGIELPWLCTRTPGLCSSGSSWRKRYAFGALPMDADGDIETLLGSLDAHGAMAGLINTAVQGHTRDVDERLVKSGPLRLPRFADAFAPRLYLIPFGWAVVLAVDVSTPEMDALFAIDRSAA
ncbi:hypothetical protein pkur_cds_392 [Pandoravirus kuranda]|uniref:Uncharacterized protein n=1 Tax=Pandoravirus kuranda TaxID=3019033 RepID=A0AA95EEH3_9VIRU|nr:hypothetical protein pkur_cds_392 [Pandoravirus kuranda]